MPDSCTPLRGRGTLVLVVGPSGAGKDSVIGALRQRLAGDDRVAFARRVITRAVEEGGESHEAVDWPGFLRRRAAGDFCLSWEAYGHGYGIPKASAAALATGRCVVANVSRSVIDEARARLAPVLVVTIWAPAEILTERLKARGRETDDDLAERVARIGAYRVFGPDVVELRNDGRLEEAVDRFELLLRGLVTNL